MKPKYKIGDQVLIKSKYDPGKRCWDYPCGFTSLMLSNYGGKLSRIIKVQFDYFYNIFVYILEDNYWNWSEDMFDPITDEL